MKRYVGLLADLESAGYLTEDPEGEWVRYEDAQAAIAQLADVKFRPIAERLVTAAIEEAKLIAEERAELERLRRLGLEAEQRVLDAMADVPIELVRAWCAKHSERSVMGTVARAELARREREDAP